MYYPSFFASVRPFETVGTLGPARERLENPLDLSVKQVTRAEGSCGPDHEEIQIMMEHRKFAVAAAAAAGLQTGPYQMPLLDGLYGYKPFGSDPQCSIPVSSSGLLGQSLSPFCTNGPTNGGVNPHLGLMPGLLQQSRDTLTLEAPPSLPPPPPLTPFPMDPSGIPYHMRINNAAAAAAIAINNANQRAVMYGHGALPPPHIASSFGALPQFSIYSDLLSDMTRRPVELEKGAFSAIPSLRSPAEPSTRFSDHLQRLREQHLQQNKCNGPCCVPPPGHGHTSSQSSSHHHLGNATTGNASACNCCSVPIPHMASSGSLPPPPQSITPMASHASCNSKSICNNNNCSPKTSVSSDAQLYIESHSPLKHDIKTIPSHLHQKPQLWNPSQSIQSSQTPPPLPPPSAASKSQCNMYSHKDITAFQSANTAKTVKEKICDDNKNNGINISGAVTAKLNHNNEESCLTNNEIMINNNNNANPMMENDCSQMRENFRDAIRIDTDCHSTTICSKDSNNARSKHELHSPTPELVPVVGPALGPALALAPSLAPSLDSPMPVTQLYMKSESKRAHLSHSNSNNNGIATSSSTTTVYSNDKVSEPLNQSNVMMEEEESPEAKTSHESQPSNSGGSFDNNILNTGNSTANSALSVPSQVNGTTAINANGHHTQQRTPLTQKTNEIKLSQFKSYFSNGKTQHKNEVPAQNQHDHNEPKHQTAHQVSAMTIMNVKDNAIATTINSSINSTINSTMNNTSTITKQLKDYKLLPKNVNSIDKNRRHQKETKTVEVQCDGPDWTPIVLPAQLKSRLQKMVRRKMTLNRRDIKNNAIANQLINHKKETKRKKKCKQQHNHRNRSPSPSSSPSSDDSRSSPERKRHLSFYSDETGGKSRKRSMLHCLENSDGFVGDKIKRKYREPNLFASDPAELGREERALQRAMKHFEELDKPSDKSERISAEEYNDNDTSRNSKCNDSTNNNSNNSNSNNNNSNNNNFSNDSGKSRGTCRKHHKSNCSIVTDPKFKSQTFESLKPKKKSNKKSNQDYDGDCQVSRKSNKSKTSKKMDAKEKSKLKLLEKLLEEQKSEDGDDTVERKSSKKKKKTKINEKRDDDDAKANANEDASQPNVMALQWTHKKKAMGNVRRRRFRSGLDMIRHAHRRKKSRTNHKHGSNAKNGATGEECADLKTNEYAANNRSTGSEPGNASLPEMKRLMVNKALGETLLHRAARSNRKDVVQYCLGANICDINTRDNAGYTPLHECCTRGHLEIARTLLRHGADVNASAAGGIRPLHDAIENNHVEVSRLLLAYGADPNISTYSGMTPLKLARSKAMVEFLKGFLCDISGEIPPSDSKPVLPWKFTGSASFLDASENGLNVLDGVPSDGDWEEYDDFLFEVSDTPLDPTYRVHSPNHKSTDFLRLSDVLRRTGLSKDEFVKTHPNIEIMSIPRHEFENATISQLLTPSRHESPIDCYSVDIVWLDDNIRNILGIETVRLR